MKRDELESILREVMLSRHWHFKSLCHLSSAYVRDTPVTPAYVPNLIRRSDTFYLVSGYVGIIDRQFEEFYSQKIGHQSPHRSVNSFCLALDVANIDALRNLRFLEREDYARALINFASSLSDFLEQMPHDESALKDVIESNCICGIPLKKFVLFGQGEKFKALEEYLGIMSSAEESSVYPKNIN